MSSKDYLDTLATCRQRLMKYLECLRLSDAAALVPNVDDHGDGCSASCDLHAAPSDAAHVPQVEDDAHVLVRFQRATAHGFFHSTANSRVVVVLYHLLVGLLGLDAAIPHSMLLAMRSLTGSVERCSHGFGPNNRSSTTSMLCLNCTHYRFGTVRVLGMLARDYHDSAARLGLQEHRARLRVLMNEIGRSVSVEEGLAELRQIAPRLDLSAILRDVHKGKVIHRKRVRRDDQTAPAASRAQRKRAGRKRTTTCRYEEEDSSDDEDDVSDVEEQMLEEMATLESDETATCVALRPRRRTARTAHTAAAHTAAAAAAAATAGRNSDEAERVEEDAPVEHAMEESLPAGPLQDDDDIAQGYDSAETLSEASSPHPAAHILQPQHRLHQCLFPPLTTASPPAHHHLARAFPHGPVTTSIPMFAAMTTAPDALSGTALHESPGQQGNLTVWHGPPEHNDEQGVLFPGGFLGVGFQPANFLGVVGQMSESELNHQLSS